MTKFKSLLAQMSVAVFAGIFVACGGNDDVKAPDSGGGDGDGAEALVKRLKSIHESCRMESSVENRTFTFDYGDDGVLRSVTLSDGNGATIGVTTYSWSNDMIVGRSETSVWVYEMEKGRVKSVSARIDDVDMGVHKVKYDYLNRMIALGDNVALSWDGYSVTKIMEKHADPLMDDVITDTFDYDYGKALICCGVSPVPRYYNYGKTVIYDLAPLSIACPELFGLNQISLPDKLQLTSSDVDSDSQTLTYSYDFDSDGYVGECRIEGTVTGANSIWVSNRLTFIWE